MTEPKFDLSRTLGEFKDRAPTGYALGLHINFTTPAYFFQSYPRPWLDHYSQAGLLINDPTVSWGFENIGHSRWSDMNDPAGVLAQAAQYGMKYGLVCATSHNNSHSIASFTRGDREFTDAEIDELVTRFHALHDASSDQAALPEHIVTQLKKMSIMVAHPGS